jgi:VWFA-related protein
VASLRGDRAAEQQPAATFRSSIEAVQFDVFVADAAGHPVSGLMVDDFELIENGKPQPITTFEAVNIPIERAEPLERLQVDADVLTNDRPQGRVYVFAVDEIEPCNALRTRRFLRDFLDRFFGPNDIGAVVLTGRGLTTDGQGFTSSRRLLLEAVEKLSGGFSDPTETCLGRYEPKDARTGGSERTGLTPVPAPGAPTPPARGRSQQVASLRDLIESVARIPGRHKAMLFFAEGIEVDMQDIVDYNGGVLSLAGDDAHAAMMAATRTNLRIYPIDPTGLAAGLTGALAQQRFDSMHALANATGGFALANSNSFAETFERIVRDNSTYYMLGFNSGYDRTDGRYVRVEVRTKRPGLTVHAREGYVARSREEQLARERVQSSPTPLEAALGNPLTASGVPMRVFATPFRGSGKNATVMLTVEIDARSLELTAGNGVYTGTLDLRYVATDAKLKVYPEVRHNATVQIKAASGPGGTPSSGPPVVPSDLRARVATMLELPEGRYQLRVAAATAGRTGNVVYDLEIPDFREQPLMMSGLAVYTPSEARVLTLRPTGSTPGKPMTCRRSPCVAPLSASPSPQGSANSGQAGPAGTSLGTPTGAREFAASEPVVLALEVYDNTKRRAKDPRPAITLSTELRDVNGAVIPLTSDERGASSEASASDRYPYEVRLPLQKVPRGAYVLRVQARSAGDQERVVVREIPIRVR